MKKNFLYYKKKSSKLNYWYNIFFKYHFFIGGPSLELKRSNVFFLNFIRFNVNVLNIQKILFKFKKINFFFKHFSFYKNKYQSFLFLAYEKEIVERLQPYSGFTFYDYMDLKKDVSFLNTLLYNKRRKPRKVILISKNYGFFLIKSTQKLGIPNLIVQDLGYLGNHSNYLLPWNLNNNFSAKFIFYLFFYFLKKDRLNYFFFKTLKN